MEKAHMMVLHATIIGGITHLFLRYVLKEEFDVAESRSVLLAALILVYMILFGHGLPTKINKNLLNK
jgi:hypothetical protein